MSIMSDIIGDPYRRTKTMYHFKISRIEGDTIFFHDASMVTNQLTLENDSDFSLEDQYDDKIDNLFISMSINGEYFFYQKVSNTKVLRPY